jgi:hypothetical protein
MWSAVAYAETKPFYEWVAPGKSRIIAGLRHAAFSAVLGWWSPMGAITNLSVVINDLAGGVDVTAYFRPEDPFVRAGELTATEQLTVDLKRKERVHAVTCVISLFAYIAVAIVVAYKLGPN